MFLTQGSTPISDQAPELLVSNMMQKGGNLMPPCMPLSEHHEYLDPLAPLLADCLEK